VTDLFGTSAFTSSVATTFFRPDDFVKAPNRHIS
jgi:hypothetical protein